MPSSPPSLCTKGCGTLVYSGGQCADCLAQSRRESDRKRPSGYARGWTDEWAIFRKRYLLEHPYCTSPKCEVKPEWDRPIATDIDHLNGHSRTCAHKYDRAHLQALCHSCHSAKTAREDGAYGHTATPRCTTKG